MFMTRASHLRVVLLAFFAVFMADMGRSAEPLETNLARFPQSIDPKCNFGRAKLYDECSSQQAIFDTALKAANEQGKTLLVSYGAEWCIWCHVFDQYLLGAHTIMEYRYSDPGEKLYYEITRFERPNADPSLEALFLKHFAEKNLVVVHIENRFSPDGLGVLERASAVDHFSGGIPFIFTVDRSGTYASALNSTLVETRRDTEDWYRGYNRNGLVAELKRMILAAQ